MVETTGTHPKELWPGIKKITGDSYKEIPLQAAMMFPTAVSSDKAYEEYLERTGLGLAPAKAEAAAIQYDVDGQGYTTRLVNVTYALGAKVSKEAISDNQYFAVGSIKGKQLGRSIRQTEENVAANIYNRAFSSSYLGGDGKELCATDHPTVNGTQSNELAVAADFSEAALEDLLTQIMQTTDSRGLRAQITGQKLVNPPALDFAVTRVLSSTNQSGTANNDINAVRAMGLLPGGHVTGRYLSDSDAWFILTDADNGLIRQSRWAMEVDKDNEFDTKNACFSAMKRMAYGWHDWRGLAGSPGA